MTSSPNPGAQAEATPDYSALRLHLMSSHNDAAAAWHTNREADDCHHIEHERHPDLQDHPDNLFPWNFATIIDNNLGAGEEIYDIPAAQARTGTYLQMAGAAIALLDAVKRTTSKPPRTGEGRG